MNNNVYNLCVLNAEAESVREECVQTCCYGN